jgi:hypothetical protein
VILHGLVSDLLEVSGDFVLDFLVTILRYTVLSNHLYGDNHLLTPRV